jgi:hypothetical protein
MKWSFEEVSHPRGISLSLRVDEIDIVRSNVPPAIREWYESLPEKKLSDELFYLSEIVKGLEEAKR